MTTINPFDDYPGISFEEIKEGDTIGYYENSGGREYAATLKVDHKDFLGSLVNEEGSAIRPRTEGQFYLIDRPGPEPLETRSIVVYQSGLAYRQVDGGFKILDCDRIFSGDLALARDVADGKAKVVWTPSDGYVS